MTSALLLAATVRHLNSLKPRFLKKFRESTFGSHIIVLNTDVGEAWIVLDTVLGVFLPIEETPILKPSRGFTLNIKRMIEGAKVSDIAQPDLERIVHIQLQTRRRDLHLYLELFGGGNIVLTNSDGKIIACRRALKVRHRRLSPGHGYAYPPSRGSPIHVVDPSILSPEASRSKKNIAAFLVSNIAISKEVVEEALARLGLSRDAPAMEFGGEALRGILNQAKDIVEDVLVGMVEPTIIYEDGKPLKLLPFRPEMDGEIKTFDTLVEAGNAFFVEFILPKKMEEMNQRKTEPLRSRRRLISNLEKQLIRLAEEASNRRLSADYLQTQVNLVQEMFQDLNSCLKEGTLKNLVGRRYGKFTIRMIDAGKRRVSFEDEENSYTLNFSLSPFQALGKLYDKAKKAERGLQSLRDNIEKLRDELEVGGEEIIEEVLRPIPRRRKIWYERFKWTFSSDGFLIVGGRDAATNESLIKRHCEPSDLVFHADIVGSPFVVVKTGGETPTESTVGEAATFAASHSRAWREGLGAVDVYWVHPSQVSKTSPSGEYLRKGSFMIQGKRNYLGRVELRLAVGIRRDDGEVSFMVGPVTAVEKSCPAHLVIEPGRTKKLEFAREAVLKLIRMIGGEMGPKSSMFIFFVEELVRLLPPGRVSKVDST